jgi:biopolymer transport protein ExbD
MPNMTPMVDIVMVILVFFMATASVMGPEWLLRSALASPRARDSSAPAEVVPVRVAVSADGATATVFVGSAAGKMTPMAGLEAVLRAAVKEAGRQEVAVSMDPDTATPYDAVVKAHEACERAGITKVGTLPGK